MAMANPKEEAKKVTPIQRSLTPHLTAARKFVQGGRQQQ
jgi:hypothetical protein